MADQLDDDLNDDLLDEVVDEDESKVVEDETEAGEQKDGSFVAEVEEGDDKTKQKEAEDSTGDDNDREALRERRRQEKIDRRNRAKEREERLKRELESERTARQQLEQRIALVERKSTGAEMAQLDNSIKQMEQAHAHYKEQIRLGQEAGNGAMVADATEKMMLAQQRYSQLSGVKKAYQQHQQQPAPLDPLVVSQAKAFMDKHKWYRPESPDNDTIVTRALDNKLVEEGWNPATPEYWQELESRVKKYLPHRSTRATVSSTDQQGRQGTKPKSPVGGSGREGTASVSAKGTFHLSSERVQALKDAGMWDDAKKREEAIKSYRDYDKAQKGR